MIFLGFSKDKITGALWMLNLISLIISVTNTTIDIQFGSESRDFKIHSDSTFGLGETKNIEDDEISEYTVHIGKLTTGCINNLSVVSTYSSEGDYNSVTLCSNQELQLKGWSIKVKDIQLINDIAIVSKTKFTRVPLFIPWIISLLLFIVSIIIHFVFLKDKLEPNNTKPIKGQKKKRK